MSRVLAISPHLDDAIFSAGATLAQHVADGDDVTIITCFTGNVAQPQGFALACQLDKGLSASVDYMALRRAEDAAACAALGARHMHLPHLEAPHRGYDSAPALFAGVLTSDGMAADLRASLAAILAHEQPDILYGPMAVGDHVDHIIVREVLEEKASQGLLWEDFPYAMRNDQPAADAECRHPADVMLEKKINAAACYTSQIPFQFGSLEEMRHAMAGWKTERFVQF